MTSQYCRYHALFKAGQSLLKSKDYITLVEREHLVAVRLREEADAAAAATTSISEGKGGGGGSAAVKGVAAGDGTKEAVVGGVGGATAEKKEAAANNDESDAREEDFGTDQIADLPVNASEEEDKATHQQQGAQGQDAAGTGRAFKRARVSASAAAEAETVNGRDSTSEIAEAR
jgi:hypothetical protein